jgi:SAM-dependent methyltransferase
VLAGVVDALRTIHRALRPGGALLDIHPEPVPLAVEVWRDGAVRYVGALPERGVIPRIHAVRPLLDALVGAGYFALRRVRTFDFVAHLDSFEDFGPYMARWQSSTVIDEAVAARARSALAEGGELCVRERVRALGLARTEPPGETADPRPAR